jgi:uncharacterized membrane protein
MYRIVGIDGNIYGPVTETQVRQWINEGRANAQTLAQAQGATDWKPLGAFSEFAEALAVPPLLPPPPTAAAQPASAEELNAILKRDYALDIGGCIGGWWELLKRDYWSVFTATLIVILINGAAAAVPYGIGYVISLFLHGQLMGGLFFYYIRKIRGHNPQIGDVFAGFSRNPGQLILTNICISLATTLLALIGIVALIAGFWLQAQTAEYGQIVLASAAFFFVVSVLVAIYLYVAWYFALALVMDKQLRFWDALELSRKTVHKHWWTVFGLGLLCGLIYLLGICGCFIGILFTAPIAFGAMMYGYEAIFGSLYKIPAVAQERAAQLPQY